jgi:hypothetical protein
MQIYVWEGVTGFVGLECDQQQRGKDDVHTP